jgi:hypothetical protein
MKQDADVFCVKYEKKCGLCALQVLFKVCGGFHMQTTMGGKKTKPKKRALPAAFIFNLPTETGLTCNVYMYRRLGSSLHDTDVHLRFHRTLIIEYLK